MLDRRLGKYDIGDMPILTATFTDVSGGTGVSDAVEFKLKKPSGTTITFTQLSPEVTGPSDNVWKLTCPILDESGVWWVRAASTSGIISAEEGYIEVKETYFPVV